MCLHFWQAYIIFRTEIILSYFYSSTRHIRSIEYPETHRNFCSLYGSFQEPFLLSEVISSLSRQQRWLLHSSIFSVLSQRTRLRRMKPFARMSEFRVRNVLRAVLIDRPVLKVKPLCDIWTILFLRGSVESSVEHTEKIHNLERNWWKVLSVESRYLGQPRRKQYTKC